MSNLFNEAKKSQVLALGHLGWSIRRIQRETGVDRSTITAHLKAAAVPVRPVGHRNPQGNLVKVTEPFPGPRTGGGFRDDVCVLDVWEADDGDNAATEQGEFGDGDADADFQL